MILNEDTDMDSNPIKPYVEKWEEHGARIGAVHYYPGNGTKYDLMYGRTPNLDDRDGPEQFFCTWLEGASGRTVKHSIGGYCHWTYTKEKMRLSNQEDAKAISHFINSINCRDYPYPASHSQDILPRGMKEEVTQ